MNKIIPILFNSDMVRSILDDRKTATRRICKDGNYYTVPDMSFYNADKRTYAVHNYADPEHIEKLSIVERTCPICPGDILYVRETVWQKTRHYLDVDGETKGVFDNEFRYVATDKEPEVGWNYSWAKRPSIHMPRKAARIFLKVTDVRVEQLRNMKPEDIRKEGIRIPITPNELKSQFNRLGTIYNYEIARKSFQNLWNSTIKKSDLDRYGWDASPWVWVIEFERYEKPETFSK